MRRGGGVIPPGRAGLVVLAVAMVPLAIKKFPKAVRWVGRKLEKMGTKVQGSVDEVERYERERHERAQSKESSVKEQVTPQDEHEPTPSRKTASPHSQVEMEAQKTKPKKAAASGGKGTVKRKTKIEGAAPPANDPKRSRRKAEGTV